MKIAGNAGIGFGFFKIMFVLSMIASILIVFSAAPVNADWVGTCDQLGVLKNTFYTNETVYATSGNITSAGDQSVHVYVTINNNSWIDGNALNDVRGTGYQTITTNSSKNLPVTSIWAEPEAGTYDIVADVNMDSEYNSTYDFVNSSSTVGFTVIQAPVPTLDVETGKNNPSSHEWDLENDTGHNSMLQLNFTALIESVRISSVVISASGSGDDKEDITVVYLILDENGSGEYDRGELILGYTSYFYDDGVITFEIDGGHVVSTEGSSAMLITYDMSSAGQSGSTYKFDIVLISATGDATLESASIVGLPIGSAIKTISGEAATTTTTISPTTTTTTTTIPTDECLTDEDCGGMTCSDKQKTTYGCVYDSNKGVNVCAGTIVSVICCGSADCVEGYYCLDYKCVKEGGGIGGWIGGGLGGREYKWTIISIAVVAGLAVVVFFIIKNRGKRPWKSKKQWKSRKDYEKEWERLRGKWGKKK